MSEGMFATRGMPSFQVVDSSIAFPLMTLPAELRKRCYELYFLQCIVCVGPMGWSPFRTITYAHDGTPEMDEERTMMEKALNKRDPAQMVAPQQSRAYKRLANPVSHDLSALLRVSRTVYTEAIGLFQSSLHFRLSPMITPDQLLAPAARIGLTNRTRLSLETDPLIPFRKIMSLQIHMDRGHQHQRCFSRLWWKWDIVDGRRADDFDEFREAMPLLRRLLIEIKQDELVEKDFMPQTWLAHRLWPVRNLDKLSIVDSKNGGLVENEAITAMGYENVLKRHCQSQMTETDYFPGWPQGCLGDVSAFRLPRDAPSEQILLGILEFVDLLQPKRIHLMDCLSRLQMQLDVSSREKVYAT